MLAGIPLDIRDNMVTMLLEQYKIIEEASSTSNHTTPVKTASTDADEAY
jgi:hypothetical protein